MFSRLQFVQTVSVSAQELYERPPHTDTPRLAAGVVIMMHRQTLRFLHRWSGAVVSAVCGSCQTGSSLRKLRRLKWE